MSSRSRCVVVTLVLATNIGCTQKSSPPADAAPAPTVPKTTAAFESHWQAVAGSGDNVMYIEDDRGGALSGNVRRATRPRPPSPPSPTPAPSAPSSATAPMPEAPRGDEIQRVIRSNLAAVKSCYLAITRHGQEREGKAILSFAIGADGRPVNVQVEAPAFEGTPLPNCLTAQVAFWSFPRSRKGSTNLSYPFVFVSG